MRAGGESREEKKVEDSIDKELRQIDGKPVPSNGGVSISM